MRFPSWSGQLAITRRGRTPVQRSGVAPGCEADDESLDGLGEAADVVIGPSADALVDHSREDGVTLWVDGVRGGGGESMLIEGVGHDERGDAIHHVHGHRQRQAFAGEGGEDSVHDVEGCRRAC